MRLLYSVTIICSVISADDELIIYFKLYYDAKISAECLRKFTLDSIVNYSFKKRLIPRYVILSHITLLSPLRIFHLKKVEKNNTQNFTAIS